MDALKAYEIGDLGDAGIGAHQQLLCLLQPDLYDVAEGRAAVDLLEGLNQSGLAAACQSRQILQSDLAHIAFPDEAFHLLDVDAFICLGLPCLGGCHFRGRAAGTEKLD